MGSHDASARAGERRPRLSNILLAAMIGVAARSIHAAFGDGARHVRPTAVAPVRRERAGAPASEPQRRSDPPDTPSAVGRRGWWDILKRTFAEVNEDRVLAVAGGVTFYSLLSLFPAITVAVSLYGLFSDPQVISQHLQMLSSFLPESAMSIIGSQVTRIAAAGRTGLGLAAIGGVLLALWSANSAMKAMMDALNIAYDTEETRSFIKLNLVSLAFMLSAMLGFFVMVGVVAVAPAVLKLLWLGPIADTLLSWGRWIVAFVLIIVALAVLYQWGPSRRGVRWKWITPGSILASAGLLAFSILFSWYAANLSDYNETYGSLGAVIAFLTWLWLSAVIVLVGAEINSEIEDQARPGAKPDESVRDKA